MVQLNRKHRISGKWLGCKDKGTGTARTKSRHKLRSAPDPDRITGRPNSPPPELLKLTLVIWRSSVNPTFVPSHGTNEQRVKRKRNREGRKEKPKQYRRECHKAPPKRSNAASCSVLGSSWGKFSPGIVVRGGGDEGDKPQIEGERCEFVCISGSLPMVFSRLSGLYSAVRSEVDLESGMHIIGYPELWIAVAELSPLAWG